MRSYKDKNFGSNKSRIETKNFNFPKEKGGWFGLTHKDLEKHYKLFKKNLRTKSPFVAIERDSSIIPFLKEQKEKIKDERVKIKRGDLFDTLFAMYPKVGHTTINGFPTYRVPLFVYGHLDFCCSACGLTDELIEVNLRRLAKWWNLKNTFYLDITVAHRGDKGFNSGNVLLNHFIPVVFEQVNWELLDMYVKSYKDSSLMTNVLYKFKRKRPIFKE